MKPISQHPTLRRALVKTNGCWLTAAWLLLATTATPAAESLSVLLQKGIFAEETEGNLDAAIKIYEGIAKDGDVNRSLVAQAQYRLGMCQLKRGKRDDAEAAFRKIIGQFADQPDVSEKARERLNEMGKSVSSFVVRQVWSGQEVEHGSLSSDGRYLAFVDGESGNLAVRDFATGQTRRLTSNASWEKPLQFAGSCAFSREGNIIAYSWYGTNDSYVLRIISLENSNPRNLFAKGARGWLSAEDWSPDGKSIAVFDTEKTGTNSHTAISLINVADGAIRKVTEESASFVSTLRFSPDGRYLAFNRAPRFLATGPVVRLTNDICVVDVQTGIGNAAVRHFANEQFVGWGPRGHELVFRSERRETVDLWSAQLKDGLPEGSPRLLKTEIGEMDLIGITRDGSLFYGAGGNTTKNLYIVSVDIEEGRVIGRPKEVHSRVVGLTDKAIPSRNGRYLFFRAGLKEPAAYIRDMESGEQREIEGSRSWASRIGWWWSSPDDSSILVSLYGPDNEGGFYTVNTQTGVKSQLALHGQGTFQRADPLQGPEFERDFVAYVRWYSSPKKIVLVKHDLRTKRETEYEIPGLPDGAPEPHRNRPRLLPDGRSFFFNRTDSSNLNVLVWHDLMTGSQKEFLTTKSPVSVFPNPDCSLVRFVTDNDQGRPVYTLYSFANLELRQTHQMAVPKGFQFWGELWGGPYIILKKTEERDRNAPAELWRLSVRTGELKSLGLSLPRTQSWGFTPNGKWLLYHIIDPGSREVWVMENFLPRTAIAQ